MGRPRAERPRLQVEALEPRLLLSATTMTDQPDPLAPDLGAGADVQAAASQSAEAFDVADNRSAQPAAPAAAGLPNGGFEVGDLTNWSSSGSAARVEVLEKDDFTTSSGPAFRPTPTEGNYFALLSTGPGQVNVTAQGNIDGDTSVTADYDTSILTTTFTLDPGDVPVALRFDWSFLTAEAINALDPFDDFFQVTLNGEVILSGSRQIGGVSPYPDVATNGITYQVTGGTPGETQGSSFDFGRSDFQTFKKLITNPGTYTLEFLVADQGAGDIDSGLLVDNVWLAPPGLGVQFDMLTSSDTFDDVAGLIGPQWTSSDDVTAMMQPAFSGVADATSVIRIYANDELVGQCVVGADDTDGTPGDGLGLWEITVEPLADNTYDLTVEMQDVLGNIMPVDPVLSQNDITIDTLPPPRSP
ncbi:LEPR-XLL domain-containing protein [bacterium]|nr:LEPR-XLL domain-containing protein [bacterium]